MKRRRMPSVLAGTVLASRLTLRCSGRQPGVRPVAAAELKRRSATEPTALIPERFERTRAEDT